MNQDDNELCSKPQITRKLQYIHDNPPTQLGICHQIRLFHDDEVIKVRELFKTWEHYSGNDAYPVPSSNSCPKAYYAKHRVSGSLWQGEQLMYRRSLIKHIINNWDTI
jgi:hypothetical protein